MEQAISAEATAKRPTFLTVLCILTFIGSAVGIVSAIWGYFATQAASAMVNSLGGVEGMEGMSEMPGMAEAMAAVQYAGVTMAVSVVGALLCLIGALMMWKLKKSGFYMYVLGQVAPLVTTAVLLGGSAFAGMALFMGAIFPIAFIIMYGLNLKHMR